MSDSVIAKYWLERNKTTTIFREGCFVSYIIVDKECFIEDMFVDPPVRASGQGRDLINHLSEIAKQAGCEILTAHVRLGDGGAMNTLGAAMKVGFRVAKANSDILFILKDIGGL